MTPHDTVEPVAMEAFKRGVCAARALSRRGGAFERVRRVEAPRRSKSRLAQGVDPLSPCLPVSSPSPPCLHPVSSLSPPCLHPVSSLSPHCLLTSLSPPCLPPSLPPCRRETAVFLLEQGVDGFAKNNEGRPRAARRRSLDRRAAACDRRLLVVVSGSDAHTPPHPDASTLLLSSLSLFSL